MPTRTEQGPLVSVWKEQAAGLGGVWARENTREAIWDALKRKEVYATTGDRPIVRVFAGWDFVPADRQSHPTSRRTATPMACRWAAISAKAPAGKRPVFMVQALRDPDGPNLDRIQIIKGWLGKDGKTQERIFDVAVSGGRKIGPDGRCTTPVGSTVDVANATYTNTIGAAYLSAYWKDPAFDAQQRAFYYVRVIQIPSPRWTAYDQKRFGIKMADNVPMTVTDRAYTSPVWYTPSDSTGERREQNLLSVPRLACSRMKRILQRAAAAFPPARRAAFRRLRLADRKRISDEPGRSSSRKAKLRPWWRASPAPGNGRPPARSWRA